MKHNYTHNAWEGSKYDSRLSTKDIANLLREYIKKEADLSSCKWSITTEYNAIYVSLMSAPFNPFGDLCGLYDKEQGYTQQAQMEGVSSPEAFKVIKKIQSFLLSYNYDDSDGMVDYFDRNFYDHYNIGKWDKPFKVSTKKPASEVKPMEGNGNFQMIDYSPNAVAVLGDTRSIKDSLKTLGGKFNPRLSCGAGWIFSKRKTEELKQLLGL